MRPVADDGDGGVFLATLIGFPPATMAVQVVISAQSLLDGTPTFGVIPLVENYPDLVLSDRVLDFGLDVLRTDANQIIVMSGGAMNYADAITMKLGDNATSFGAPGPNGGGGGRQIVSNAVTQGTVIKIGTARRWAAIDTVNSRLLAHGDISSP